MSVGKRLHPLGRKRNLVAAGIEHDEVVAEPVHLQEGYPIHGAVYMAAPPALSNSRR